MPAWVGLLRAGGLPDGNTERLPSAADVSTVMATVETDGWGAVAPTVRQTALTHYERGRLDLASAWIGLAQWSELLSESEAAYVPRWVQGMNRARLGHANAPASYEGTNQPLAAQLSPEFIRWALTHPEFTESFFNLVVAYDFLPSVLKILRTLHAKDARTFETYAELALAVAVVYDFPPPPGWPHGQVSARLLPRKLPEPQAAFDYFVALDRSGRSLQRLAYLSAGELRFLVDLAAPFPELTWAQTQVHQPLAQAAAMYDAVQYRSDRLQYGIYNWPGSSYSLAAILSEGGICVDQAYFAAQAGKARGVPTLIFRGAGLDGRHAWFGFLDGARRWQLDAGRYAEQRFVTGLAHDPQTWGDLSDHEVQFLSEGFRLLPGFRSSQIHQVFAQTYLRLSQVDAAVKAARKAINAESRNLPAWEILLTAQAAAGEDAKAIEVTLRDAAIAFQRYPDLSARFILRQTASLRARGETSAADYAERMFARKHQADRADLSIAQASEELSRAMASQPIFEQMRLYQTLVDQLGRGAGMPFFDKLVRPFVARLVQQGRVDEAVRAVEYARLALSPPEGSQLEAELKALAGRVRG